MIAIIMFSLMYRGDQKIIRTSVLGCRLGPGDWASKCCLPGCFLPLYHLLSLLLVCCRTSHYCFPHFGPPDPFHFHVLLLGHFLSPSFRKILVHFEGAGSTSAFDPNQIFLGQQLLEDSVDCASVLVNVVSSSFQSLLQGCQGYARTGG